jgi:hypothetical protein
MPDLGPGVTIAVVALAFALARIFRGPIGEAIAFRLRGGLSDRDVVAELDTLRGRLAGVEERLDFAERLLVQGTQADQLPGGANP